MLSFHQHQQDYSVILESLHKGLAELQSTQSRPEIVLRKVTLQNHEQLLPQFALQARQYNVISSLQLQPIQRATAFHYSSCRSVDASFFDALVVLLGATNLKELEITHIDASPELREEKETVFDRLRRAIEENKTLARLALGSTRCLKELWQWAIFPALTVNRSLHRLEFAHVHTTAVTSTFLQLLPHMQGLRYVHAPGRHTFGQLWWDRLQEIPPMDLTVEFSLGAFRPTTTLDQFHAIDCLLQRNRLFVRAGTLVKTLATQENVAHDGRILDALVTYGQDEQGLSAVYIVLRNCLSLF